MPLIITIDLLVIFLLIYLSQKRGFEAALPCFVFFVTLLPEECRVNLAGLFELYTHRLALIVLFILFLASRKKFAIRRIPLRSLIFLHVGWVLISTAVSIVTATSFKIVLAQVAEYYLVYYIFLKSILKVQTIYNILFAMVAAMCVASVFGLFDIYANWSVLTIFPSDLQQTYGTGDPLYAELTGRGVRARSTFPHPILLGAALAMTIPVMLYLLSIFDKGVKKLFLQLSLVLAFWALFKTSSRGPWLATGLSLTPLILVSKKKTRQWLLIAGALAVAVLILRPGVAETIGTMFWATLDPNNPIGESYQYRPALLRTVNQSLSDDPVRALFGFGLGSFREKGLVVEMPGIETHRWYTCDSSWIQFAYETGYVGCLILATLLLKPLLIAWNSYRRLPKSDAYFCFTCMCCLFACYFCMGSVSAYGWGQNGYMLWILISCTISYSVQKSRETRLKKINKLESPKELVVSYS
jgi:hypothetical protein